MPVEPIQGGLAYACDDRWKDGTGVTEVDADVRKPGKPASGSRAEKGIDLYRVNPRKNAFKPPRRVTEIGFRLD